MSLIETLKQLGAAMSSRPRAKDVRLLKSFGKKLRALRLERDITLKDLAESLGYRTHSHISAVESGAKLPTVELVVKVGRFFDVTMDSLLDDRVSLPTRAPVRNSS